MTTSTLLRAAKANLQITGYIKPQIKKFSTRPFLKWVGGKTQLLDELKK